MTIYQSFENAIKAQKNAIIGFMCLGALFVAISLYLFFLAGTDNPIRVAQWPGLVAGLGIIIGGIFYLTTINNHFKAQTAVYRHNPSAFVKSEIARATRLYKGYKQYTLIYVGIMFAAIALILFFRRSVVGGVGYVLLLFSFFTVLSETYSINRTGRYLDELSKWTKRKK